MTYFLSFLSSITYISRRKLKADDIKALSAVEVSPFSLLNGIEDEKEQKKKSFKLIKKLLINAEVGLHTKLIRIMDF